MYGSPLPVFLLVSPYANRKLPMALESAQYIHQLEQSNPAPTDQLAQADDHLRLIKSTLKATFPNIEGPVTASHEELNNPFSLPTGGSFVSIWIGSKASIPSGWAPLDGGTYEKSDGTGDITLPDWTNHVPIGAGSIAGIGVKAGSASSSSNTGSSGSHTHTVSGGSHTHSGSAQGHALTEAELPAHKHGAGIVDKSNGLFANGSRSTETNTHSIDRNDENGYLEAWSSTVGGGQAHSHDLQIEAATHSHNVSSGGAHTHSVSVSTIQPSVGVWFIAKI